jgi:hypothetical protein
MSQTQIVFKSLHPAQWTLQATADEMLRELDGVILAIQMKLGITTATWTHKPVFQVLGRVTPGAQGAIARVEISTDDEIFGYLDKGTPAHSISPKSPVSKRDPTRPSALATRAGYKAKSTPGSLSSGGGGHFGAVIYKPGVWHPGIAPRRFMETLQVWAQGEMERRMPQAVQRGLERGIKQVGVGRGTGWNIK